jgi:hypothetical protein
MLCKSKPFLKTTETDEFEMKGFEKINQLNLQAEL